MQPTITLRQHLGTHVLRSLSASVARGFSTQAGGGTSTQEPGCCQQRQPSTEDTQLYERLTDVRRLRVPGVNCGKLQSMSSDA